MVLGESSQAVNRDSNAVSLPTPTTSRSPAPPPPTQQPPQQQTAPGTQQQQPQMQGEFQPVYFKQDPRAYGQPFQPYTAQPYNAQALPQGQFQPAQVGQFPQYQQQQPVPTYVANAITAWTWAKIILHAFDIICCIVAIGISFSFGTYSEGGYAFVLCTPIFFLALVWDSAEIITWLLRKRKAGIHPGAHVGVSLIVWLGAAIVGGMQATFIALVISDNSDCWEYESQSYVSCASSYTGGSGLFIAVAVFSCLVWLIHFTLFVCACMDTARRNRNRRIVTVVAPPYWGPMAQGWQPMPQYYPQTAVPQNQGQNTNTTAPQLNIPLQNRSPAEGQTGNGKAPEQPIVNDKQGESSTQPVHPSINEYYTPSAR
ncbi:hypothetical protein G7Z17_g4187 [Cylindrodendrum hubeiense]|uniref:MARVEL domain-containing protein n=1 Tax=Cylindrodendrum hubeiense TaxID=595255 RepID=A0A9P5HD99_9HYPO|nr:hypothetical protein G7Z17_g4187 [Cylindrodendrum hubeiense]